MEFRQKKPVKANRRKSGVFRKTIPLACAIIISAPMLLKIPAYSVNSVPKYSPALTFEKQQDTSNAPLSKYLLAFTSKKNQDTVLVFKDRIQIVGENIDTSMALKFAQAPIVEKSVFSDGALDFYLLVPSANSISVLHKDSSGGNYRFSELGSSKYSVKLHKEPIYCMLKNGGIAALSETGILYSDSSSNNYVSLLPFTLVLGPIQEGASMRAFLEDGDMFFRVRSSNWGNYAIDCYPVKNEAKLMEKK